MVEINLTFDLEEQEGDEPFKNSYDGTLNILNLLKHHKFKGIFFVTAFFSKKYPSLIKQIIKEKHEIACHGYAHSDDYKLMPPDEALKKIKHAKQTIEKISKKKIHGFRAPRFQHPPYKIIKKAGFKYDSSLQPTWLPKFITKFWGSPGYFNLSKSRFVHEKDNLKIIPLTVTPFLRIPISWFWFNLFPLWFIKQLTKICLIDQNIINIYFHSWEFNNSKKIVKFNKYLTFLRQRYC